VPPEERVVGGVGEDADGHVPADLEPLRAFPPLWQPDGRRHPAVVPAAALLGLHVVHLHEAVPRAHQVVAHRREALHRDAALGEEHEPLVREVEKRVRQQPLLRVQQRYGAPRGLLEVAIAG